MSDVNSTMLTFPGASGPLQAYLSRPEGSEPRPAVIVIHEIYGLDNFIKSVADRFAHQGYAAFAPNLFSRPGLADALTPEAIADYRALMSRIPLDKRANPAYREQEIANLPPEERERVGRANQFLFGGLPRNEMTQDLVNTVSYLKTQPYVKNGQVASLGFCFGGGMSFRLVCQAPLTACVVFYGENPDPIEQVENIHCPVLGLYGGEDLRISNNLDSLVKAMVDYKKDFEMRIYPGAPHAFFNDTNPMTYRQAAAAEAWERVLHFFQRTLA